MNSVGFPIRSKLERSVCCARFAAHTHSMRVASLESICATIQSLILSTSSHLTPAASQPLSAPTAYTLVALAPRIRYRRDPAWTVLGEGTDCRRQRLLSQNTGHELSRSFFLANAGLGPVKLCLNTIQRGGTTRSFDRVITNSINGSFVVHPCKLERFSTTIGRLTFSSQLFVLVFMDLAFLFLRYRCFFCHGEAQTATSLLRGVPRGGATPGSSDPSSRPLRYLAG